MTYHDQKKFRSLIDDVSKQLVFADHREDGSFIKTPLIYPSGKSVVVKIISEGESFFVSDIGFGFQESIMYGASAQYSKQAKTIAENSGVFFDNQAFFYSKTTKEQLAGVIVIIANCSQEATILASHKSIEKQKSDEAQFLFDKLNRFFPQKVIKNAEIFGSSLQWNVAAAIYSNDNIPYAVFDTVVKHHSSIFSAVAKFQDFANMQTAPNRIIVVPSKEEIKQFMPLLSRNADVIEKNAADDVFYKLAA